MADDENDVLELDALADDQLEGEAPPEIDNEGDDEAPQAGDNAVIRKMRAELRAAKREKADLEKRVKDSARVDPGPRPTLDDVGYIQEDYDAAVKAWEAKDAAWNAPTEPLPGGDVNERLEAKGQAFNTARAKLTADNPDAEDVILDVDTALGGIITGNLIYAFGEEAPAIMYAIGSNPDLMEKMADMNWADALVAAARLPLKGTPVARSRPDIDEPVVGKPAIRRGPDARLAKLEADAERTGDRTELIKYRKAQREKGRA